MKIHNNDVRLPFKFSQYLVTATKGQSSEGKKDPGLRR